MSRKKELKDSEDWQRYTGALLEHINGQLDTILACLESVPNREGA